MGEPGAGDRRRTAKRVGAAGAVLVVVAVALVGAGLLLRQRAIDAAGRDATTFQAPGETMISGRMGERGLWVPDSSSTSQFDVTIEDGNGPVEYRRIGMIASSSELEVDGTTYRLDGEFTPTGNTYQVTLTEREDVGEIEPLRVAVGPPSGYEVPTSTVIAVLAGVASLLLGGLLLVIALVVAVLAGRRGGAATPPPPPPPAAGYPTSF